ncbi:MAG: hypothetical protein DRJ03_05400 [Chloroflexi bacterium]|nr:MAG: hypothetical protein B6I35_08075 [Anaerolineaceae bacterium 4572_32.2]RLC81094.1 MAG: hypothetical protein DRI81_03270 [Chloroflexota bacterium]RLC87637.1 MAG: hypothetical protein DRJ03_05400 [Chloroflexota bacterium]HEY74137.1 hypothetical protein [Thermoflexia bacterium]
MNISRVFILASQPLFAEGVQSLLSGQPGIEVVGVAPADPGAFAQVQTATPDVVIIEAQGGEQSLLVAQVLKSIPSAKVVGLSLEDNRIHTYYQQSKQGHRVEDLLDTIREPVIPKSRSPKALRLFVLYQGHYGERILANIQNNAPRTWAVESWRAPSNLPPVVDDPLSFLPTHLPAADLVLSLGENGGAAQLLPGIVERTGARALIAPVDNVTWLPDGLIRQLRVWMAAIGVSAVFPKPFCSLTENCYNVRQQEIAFEDPWIGEFARQFGRPVLKIARDGEKITQIEVERDTACGCARFVARKLAGVDLREAVIQAGLFHHHYPCRATMRVDPGLDEPLIQAAGNFMRHAVEVEIVPLER